MFLLATSATRVAFAADESGKSAKVGIVIPDESPYSPLTPAEKASQAVPAPATPAAPMAPAAPIMKPSADADAKSGKVIISAPANLALKSGSVIKVASDPVRIYVDQGTNDGAVSGTEMDVFKTEPVKGMKGELLDEDEIMVGRIRVVEVKPRLSICEVIYKNTEFERGNAVRYMAMVDRPAQTEVKGLCPAGMRYDPGGIFIFIPGAMFASEPAKEQVSDSPPFCIDMRAAEGVLTWNNAADECKRLKKRLCSRTELQKVCTTWDKPKPCPSDLAKKNACPKQDTIIDLYRNQEWTSDLVADKAGNMDWEANSCSCPGTSPVCTHCVYAGCRGARKPYRCCSEPIAAPKPAKEKVKK
jgi:hypothetical protein